jgi:hypothetical protein
VKPYILDDASAVEYKRLDLMSKILDPWTRGYLIGLGVGEGWHCLELGGGNGSIAEWLAAKVGAYGSVTAIDINPVLLELLPAQNLLVQQMDVRTGELGSEFVRPSHVPRTAASDRRVRPAGIGADGRGRQAGRMADDSRTGLSPRADHGAGGMGTQLGGPYRVGTRQWRGLAHWPQAAQHGGHARFRASAGQDRRTEHPWPGSRGAVFPAVLRRGARPPHRCWTSRRGHDRRRIGLLDDPNYWTQCWMMTAVWVRKPLPDTSFEAASK